MAIGDVVKVLDHGFVRLVDVMGDDLSVVRAARVSYDAAWRAGQDQGSDRRLIHYLYAHQHLTPFEAVTLTLEVKAPIFVFRQWHRHRTWSYNELSARYRELPDEFYTPDPVIIGTQAAKNKQGRDLEPMSDKEITERQKEVELFQQACAQQWNAYRFLLDRGWPRELARAVLPVNAYSHMFATVDLRNLFAFLNLRLDVHAQWEIRQYAAAIVIVCRDMVPNAFDAWEAAAAAAG
jgi:thymidylate synthase (FAD)